MSVLAATSIMAVLAGAAGFAVSASNRRGALDREHLAERLEAMLPQTQCGRCTFEGCKPYAAAIAAGIADINQCPPGGDRTAAALARIAGRPAKPVDRKFGVVGTIPSVAVILEDACIGCTKCIQACPVDAIVGASRHMHTVIADHCTGCELCIPPCPVDCIVMRPRSAA